VSCNLWRPDAIKQYPEVAAMRSYGTIASKDVNTEAEKSTALETVIKQRLVNIQKAEDTLCCCSELHSA
jgi:hypothetical protein